MATYKVLRLDWIVPGDQDLALLQRNGITVYEIRGMVQGLCQEQLAFLEDWCRLLNWMEDQKERGRFL